MSAPRQPRPKSRTTPTYCAPASGWVYVQGAVNGAFYELPGGRVVQIAQPLSSIVRRLALGESVEEAGSNLRAEERKAALLVLHSLSCVVHTHVPSGPWPLPTLTSRDDVVRPTGAFLELTTRCNLRCVHCYANAGPRATADELTTAEWLDVYDRLKAEGFDGVILTGGEPLLRDDFPTLLEAATRVFEGRVTVLTNATLIDEAMARLLALHRVRVSLSFYSHDAREAARMTGVDDSWQRTVRAMEHLLAAGVDFGTNVVLEAGNTESYPRTRAFLLSLGLDDSRIAANPVMPSGRGCTRTVDLDALRNEFPLRPFSHASFRSTGTLSCSTCWRGQLTVTPTGELLLCNMLRDLSIGDLRNDELHDVVYGERCQTLWRWSLDDVEACRACELRFACYDCRSAAHSLSGDILGRNPLCRYQPLTGAWSMTTHVSERADWTPESKPRKSRDVTASKVGGNAMLREPDGKGVFTLNECAARIWKLCNGQRTVDEIVDSLADVYDAPREQLARDVRTTLNCMRERGLLRS